MSHILDLMEQAARKAGESLLHDFLHREDLIIESKEHSSFVTEADRRSEDMIVEILRKAYPDWGILGEEGTDYASSKDGYRWIIDPLDGTTNFLHGIPDWSVTMALEKQGEIVAGITYDPTRNELYVAEKGQGAFLNGKRLQISQKNELNRFIINLDMGFSRHDVKAVKELSAASEKVYALEGHVHNGRGMALGMAYLAAGRCDLLHSWSVYPWDYAAGIILVQEAGGIVTDLTLLPVKLEKSGVLAGNAVLHSAYAKLLGLN
jgi:myo-inositol-1(or 4)-monophosphatase